MIAEDFALTRLEDSRNLYVQMMANGANIVRRWIYLAMVSKSLRIQSMLILQAFGNAIDFQYHFSVKCE